jgi:hypothetical protein
MLAQIARLSTRRMNCLSKYEQGSIATEIRVRDSDHSSDWAYRSEAQPLLHDLGKSSCSGRNVVQFAISLAIADDPTFKFEPLREGLAGRDG